MIRQTQSDSQAVSKRIGSGIDNFKTLDEKETTPSLHHTFPSFVATNHRIPLRKLSRSNQYSAKSLEIRRKLLDQSESLKHNEFLQQLTINKIQYDQIFVGREKEIRTLKNRLSRAVYSKPKTRRKELIFIKGYSGVGKSTLASALEQSVKETRTGMFVRGKFDLNHNDEPYSGIAAAFGEICRTTKLSQNLNTEKQKVTINDIGKNILDELGPETQLLARLIPELDAILPTLSSRTSSLAESKEFQSGHERIKYAFRILTRVFNSYFSPLVFVFDDLQWVDVPSLSIIDFIISDAQNSCPLLLIGCYRSNEIDNYHIVSKKRRTFAEKKIKYEFNITDIDLGDFNLVEVNQMIKSMLSIEEDQQIRGLANICFKRTLGNPFFLIEFMAMLEEDGLIEYNLGLLKWIWDDKKIVKATTSTANVTDLLQGRMQRLPENAQLLLQFASNLGSVFSLSTLNLIWERHMSSNTLRKLTSMHALLEFLEEKDFIEKCGINIYRWVHDRVQESALALGAGNDPDFQFEMGSILYHSLEKCQLDDALFDIVNLVNKRMIKRRLEFAELNLRAAEKARNISAFHTSAKYASSGILQLTRDAWETNASLALRLHTLGAEMELAVGQIVEMETYTERVLAEKSLSILERMPIYTAWSHKLQLERQYGDSVKFCLSVLKELGCNLVKVGRLLPVQVLSSFRRTVNRAKSTPQKVYRSKKRLTAKKLAAIMRFLQRLAYASYLSNSNLLMILAITRQIQITLTYGVGDSSASAFAYLGLLTTSILKDYQSAAYFGEIALLLQRSIESKYIESITVFVTYYACLPWTKPLQLSLEPFLLSYTSGMRSGYTEYSMWSLLAHHVFFPYLMGKPLSLLEKKSSLAANQCEEVNQTDQFQFAVGFQRLFLNLIEKDETSSKIYSNSQNLDRNKLGWLQLDSLVYDADYERAARLSLRRGETFQQAFPGNPLTMLETFYRGIAFYAMARKTQRRKFKKQAQKILKTVEMWLSQGNPNVQHYFILLKAEQAAIQKKIKEAESLYNQAIAYAARTGHLHHAALSSERYADFLVHTKSDIENTRYRVKETLRFYKIWGAGRKIRLLERSYKVLLRPSREDSMMIPDDVQEC